MILETLKLSNFRNYKSLDINLSDKINIFYGNNGQGKTNILEGIYVLGLTKSHRSYSDTDLIINGEKQAKIIGTMIKNNIKIDLEVFIESKNKRYKIDNDNIKTVSDYISNMNLIIFYPEDLELIKGSPSIRRKFLNIELSQLYSTYYRVISDYTKILKIRNEYLKKMNKGEAIDLTYFEILTEYLIDKSIFIYKARSKFIQKINDISQNIYKRILSLEGFNIKYKANFDIKNLSDSEIKKQFKEKLENDRFMEIKLGTTLTGPHRDDFEILIEDNNLKTYGSQGQQRLAIITIKLSEVEIFKKYCQTNPILLLDDVFSELDDDKKNKLLEYIKDDIQTIITTTDLKNINKEIIKNAKIFNVSEGKIIHIEEVR